MARLPRGEPIDAVSRVLGIEVYRLKAWRDKALAGLGADGVFAVAAYARQDDEGVEPAKLEMFIPRSCS